MAGSTVGRLRLYGVLVLMLAVGGVRGAHAQPVMATLNVRVSSEGAPLVATEVRAGSVVTYTDEAGGAVLRLPAGRHTIRARLAGYADASARVDLRAGMDTTLVLELHREVVEAEEIVVLSTRTNRRIEDEPVRVEVLAREEVEEKMLMTPGDISMLLNETSGLRVQTTSPSLGGANVRIQGLRGRYTQVLSDGLPLYGGQSGALSMLQIPPMDLGQVEVIKGVASALYGASALGGVVNLISRRPADDRELLINQTTRGGTDAVGWSSGTLSERWGYTLLGSGHRQSRHDVDDDGWADLPRYHRAVLRPRLFWSDGHGGSLFATAGFTAENREGGTLPSRTSPVGTSHIESLDTRRADAGIVARLLASEERALSVRGSAMRQTHTHRFGTTLERDRHATAFGELTLTGSSGAHLWLLGAALQHEDYAARDLPRFDYTHTVPSVFVQDEVSVTAWLTAAASARLDVHSEYGSFLNPRISLLFRPHEQWNARASIGTGYFAPTPFTEDTEVLGLTPLEPLHDLAAERALAASLDVGHLRGSLELNATLFVSALRDALALRRFGDGRVELFNAPGSTRTHGTDLLVRYHEEPLHVTATYTYTRSREENAASGGRRDVPLTPRHAAGFVGMWEPEDIARIGVELYYTGRQDLEENPYRRTSRPYLIFGILAERRFGRARLFLNAENLFDARPTRFHPLVLPAPSPEGRWTTDAWAPLEGRTFNAGVRIDF